MPKLRPHRLLPVFATLLLAGCSLLNPNALPPAPPDTLTRIGSAADDLLASTHERLTAAQPVIATTFVDVDRLDRSSTLGRTLSEAFTSQLVAGGLQMVEVKLRESLYIEQQTGELILSRNVQRLGHDYNAEVVLVGTYAQSQNLVFINARLVRLADRAILGATSFQLPLDNDLRALLVPGRG